MMRKHSTSEGFFLLAILATGLATGVLLLFLSALIYHQNPLAGDIMLHALAVYSVVFALFVVSKAVGDTVKEISSFIHRIRNKDKHDVHDHGVRRKA